MAGPVPYPVRAAAMVKRRSLLQAGAAAGIGLALVPPSAAAQAPPTAPRRRLLLDTGWRFHLGHAADMARDFGFGRDQRTYAKAGAKTADAAVAAFDDSGWRAVTVPHDWAVDLPYAPPTAPPATEDAAADAAAHGFKAIGRDHPGNSVGWYRRALTIAEADRGSRLSLEFDGVFRDCLVFVNGYIAARNDSGYAPFRVDITDFVDIGKPNVVTLRVDASLGEGWFYEGAGIYRHVWLVRTAPVHVPQGGVFVRSEVGPDGALVRVSTEIANEGDRDAAVGLRHRIVAPDGAIAACCGETPVAVAVDARVTTQGALQVAQPALWSVETPRMYRLVTELVEDGRVVDRYETPFGIRTIRFDGRTGFFLNGKPVKLLGSCNHQDHAGVGTAIPDRLHAWRVEQMQAMGSNAWRSAHNPPAEALLDICDAKGMLMIDEARLNSTAPEAIDQLERIIRRDRNHPSIILWSIGNEEPHQGSPRGARIAAEMMRVITALDPTRLVTHAFDNSFDTGASRVVDVIGFNYRTDKIEAFHQRFPDQPIIGSETGSTVSTRGEYRNDAARHIVRAYDTEYPWWASTAEQWWTIAATRPYIAGGFIWTGFDYRGEPTPFAAWPSVGSYFGVLDACGFPKDNYWYYRAWWRPDLPLVHLFPHWDWPGQDGQPIEVWVHGNCDTVELLLNGRSLGRKAMPRNGHLAWMVPYAPGRIEARGFVDGRRVATDRRETTGPAAAVQVAPDRLRINGDGRDLAVVKVELRDRAGRLVPRADALVQFAVTGPARIIGVGNGDPTSREPDHADRRHAFNGLAQLIVQSTGKPGLIRITATADGLRAGTASVIALPA